MAVSFSRTTRALDADRGIGASLALAAGLALLALWLGWFILGRVNIYEVSRSAHVQVASASREVAVEQGGRLTASGLFIGRTVRAGEVLARLDAEPQRLRLAEAEARLAAYPERLRALRAELASARDARAGGEGSAAAAIAASRARTRAAEAAAAFSGTIAEKQRLDSENGGIAPVEAERAVAEARRAAAARDALRHDEALAAGEARTALADRAGEAARISAGLSDTEGELAAMEALVRKLRLELEARKIRAPVDGVIGDVSALRLGEVLAPGTRLATIVPRGDLQVVAMFDAATGLGRLTPGQAARLRLDGFAWTQYGDFPATVERVAAEGSRGMLRVELRMPRRHNEDLPLRHGMAGQVDVTIERVSPALMVLRALGRILA